MASKVQSDHEKLTAFVERIDEGGALPEGRFDLITTFDVVHSSADPIGLMSAIRGALREDGTYLMLELNIPGEEAESRNPIGGLLYNVNALCCMTTSSLGNGGEDTGAHTSEEKARQLAYAAGFTSFRKLPVENHSSVLYELKA
jgi:hypothetical protein